MMIEKIQTNNLDIYEREESIGDYFISYRFNGVNLGHVDLYRRSNDYKLVRFTIEEDYRNKGHGTHFLKCLIDEFRCDLCLNVYNTNLLAIHLYQKVGFTKSVDLGKISHYSLRITMLQKLKSDLDLIRKQTDEMSLAKISILKLLISEIESKNAVGKKLLTDEEQLKILNKFIENNNEVIKILEGTTDERKKKAMRENGILNEYRPAYLTLEDIRVQLESIRGEIVGAKNGGIATGIAMKKLKESKANVQTEDVLRILNEFRA